MTKKRIIGVLVGAIACLCVLVICIVVQNWKTDPDSYGSYKGNASPLFQEAYQRANDKQRRQLTNIDDMLQLPGDYTRQIMIIMGDLPRNTPRLSLSEAKKICESIQTEYDTGSLQGEAVEQTICQRFNEVAGAPDFEGGSGIGRTIYYLNDTGSERLIVMFTYISYINGNDAKTFFSLKR